MLTRGTMVVWLALMAIMCSTGSVLTAPISSGSEPINAYEYGSLWKDKSCSTTEVPDDECHTIDGDS